MSKRETKDSLTDIEEQFCIEYIKKLSNGTQAYLAVNSNVTERSATAIASKLLTKINIQNRIKQLKEELRENQKIDLNQLVNAVSNVYQACMKGRKVTRWDKKEKKLIETGEIIVDSKGANDAIKIMANLLGFDGKNDKAQEENENVVIVDDIK